jgi:hypothetical protein
VTHEESIVRLLRYCAVFLSVAVVVSVESLFNGCCQLHQSVFSSSRCCELNIVDSCSLSLGFVLSSLTISRRRVPSRLRWRPHC